MAARSGGFGSGSLNPFGYGSLGSLSQYEIGADLADLEVYKVEVAWGNGLATDEEYLAALTKARDATDPDTKRRETAQNKLDDAVYRIGRSKAEAVGLDSLIAFDQAAIAKMKPDNLRFRDVKDSLDAELAQRRSRDYGKLVDAYNEGKSSTESLLSWVKNALSGMKPEDPDFDNWIGVRSDLEERTRSERDQEVYQDYQQGRMKGDAFLKYLTDRRDSYGKESPQYDDWTRRLEDATKQVRDTEQSKKDAAFFNRYEEGKVSDKDYLRYLRTRLDGMAPDDPQREEWQHRLHQASFSLAEDQLRFDVERGKKPVSSLISFYRGYRNTLNPGSAEWRQITRAIDSLVGRGGIGGGGGGGGGKGSGSAAAALGTPAATVTGGVSPDALSGVKTGVKVLDAALNAVRAGMEIGKVISPRDSLDTVLPLLTINPTAKKKDQAAAKKFFDLNYASLENARLRGDQVWLFFDPRKPGQMVPGKNPDGSPMLDGRGKPVMVPGGQYLPVSDQAFANLNLLRADYNYQLAGLALADHDAADYAMYLKRAIEAEDKARVVQAQYVARDNQQFFDSAKDGIETALKTGDYATAVNLANAVAGRLASELENPMLDDTRRDKLERLGEQLGSNPLLPKFDPATGSQVGGAIDLARSTMAPDGTFMSVALNPGWHHVLKTGKNGQADWGLEFDDRQDGTWEANHVSVLTTYGGRVVRGDVTVSEAPTNPTVAVRWDEGMIQVPAAGARYFSFVDENGQLVRSYSLDGRTWIRATPGMPAPVVEVNVDLSRKSDSDGTYLVDGQGNKAFSLAKDGSWIQSNEYFAQNPGAMSWYGEREYKARKQSLGSFGRSVADRTRQQGGDWLRKEFQYEREEVSRMSIGSPGARMMLTELSPSGVINLTPAIGEVPNLPRRSVLVEDDRQSAIRGLRDDRRSIESLYSPAPTPRAPRADARANRFAEPEYAAQIRAQLPPDQPPRFEGIGLKVAPNVPVLKPIASVLPAINGIVKAVLPPVPKTTTPPPLLNPTRTKDDRALPKPPPKPKPRPVSTPTSKKSTVGGHVLS